MQNLVGSLKFTCQPFFVLYHSIENQKSKGDCNLFNIWNVSIAKYSYPNIDDVAM